ncbi:hypothetical protein CO657_23570 (plasmid) [Rhizobium acidisoli]|uniref:Uncharacterized protein n=2 Tax=Rhizobium acidisoli TaxID=1538158 RepID=A0AAE5WRP0_9HYPH|nr:hypothetical protein AOG23_32995 [Rhizobium acidisoli]QAS81273.1 hypothetical protein CO657_23570 [Rhizobium acidisoli]
MKRDDTVRVGMSNENVINASATAERLMRAYHIHCVAPDPDTLFRFLEAAHSANDRLKKSAGVEFIDIPEFIALKCLRNFFHHHDELRHVVRVVPTAGLPILTDLLFMCLAPRDLINEAIVQAPDRFRAQTQAACDFAFHWYGTTVNINPCLFNFVVHAYERLVEASIPISGDEADEYRRSYDFEAQAGQSHFVDGRISTTAGSLDDLLSEIMS